MDYADIKATYSAVYDLEKVEAEDGYIAARAQAKFLSLMIEAILKDNPEPIDNDLYEEGIDLLRYLDDFNG